MKSVVLVPAFNRPEFLFFCIKQIMQAAEFQNYHYIFSLDFGFNQKCIEVIEHNFHHNDYEIVKRKYVPYTTGKQSYHLLDSYLYAANQSDHLIFMIEEDVMIAHGFFTMHESIHAGPYNLFCSIGVKNPNSNPPLTDDVNAYYLSHGDYCSLGVAFHFDVLQELIKPHCVNEYYSNPVRYVTKKFPNSRIGSSFSEQDGLIRRIQEHTQEQMNPMLIAYPHVPRAYHAGFYGKNRNRYYYASFEKKLEYVRETIFNDDAMQKACIRPEYFEDSKPIDLHVCATDKMYFKAAQQF